ncbi:MAG TPA: hypothetical protein VKY66_04580 [Protaetiibacter sp.]|nr:hypothetical protein [Protaetiibacter sp.]
MNGAFLPLPEGDAACWLARVCPDCGRLDERAEAERRQAPDTCPACGATWGAEG